MECATLQGKVESSMFRPPTCKKCHEVSFFQQMLKVSLTLYCAVLLLNSVLEMVSVTVPP